jgi:hypothetical protein
VQCHVLMGMSKLTYMHWRRHTSLHAIQVTAFTVHAARQLADDYADRQPLLLGVRACCTCRARLCLAAEAQHTVA